MNFWRHSTASLVHSWTAGTFGLLLSSQSHRMAIGLTAVNGLQASYAESSLPDDTMRIGNSAVEGAYISHNSVYEIILSETIPRAEIARISGERINDNGVSPWVGRELCGLHTVTLHYRNGTFFFLTAIMDVAAQATRSLTARPDLGREHPETVRRIRGVGQRCQTPPSTSHSLYTR